MKRAVALILLLVCINDGVTQGNKNRGNRKCTYQVNLQLPSQTMMVSVDKTSADYNRLIYPKNGVITLQNGLSAIFGCAGKRNNLVELKKADRVTGNADKKKKKLMDSGLLTTSSMRVQCVNSKWKLGNEEVDLTNYQCSAANVPSIHTKEGPNGLKEVEMTFRDSSSFKVKYMDLVLDANFNSLYAHIVQVPDIRESIQYRGGNFRVPNKNEILGYPGDQEIEYCYGAAAERELNKVYNAQNKYVLFPTNCMVPRKEGVVSSGLLTLSRGHLTANSDFVYAFQREATFYFHNVAPQWQVTNGGNFEGVEQMVRSIVVRTNQPVDVYTGTHGTMKVGDACGSDNIQIPYCRLRVPEAYWKLLFFNNGKNIVIIVFNSPCPLDSVFRSSLLDNNCNKNTCVDFFRNNGVERDDINRLRYLRQKNPYGEMYCCDAVSANRAFARDATETNEIQLVLEKRKRKINN